MVVRAMGVTVAVPDQYVNGRDPEDLKSDVRDLADQMVPGLRRFVGGATPRSGMATKFDGPIDDPLQGVIYTLTLAALFDDADLPADCDAYLVVTKPDAPPPTDLTGYTPLTR